MIQFSTNAVAIAIEFREMLESLAPKEYNRIAPIVIARYHAQLFTQEWSEDINYIKDLLKMMFTGEQDHQEVETLLEIHLQTTPEIARDIGILCGDFSSFVESEMIEKRFINQLITDGVYTIDTIPERFINVIDPELNLV